MIVVKILKKAQSFQGVQYNTNKVELDQGELMVVQNFEALQGIGPVRPSDYVNYLRAITNRNQRIKSPQFHAVISCKEKEKNKQELTELAQKWMEAMGYGKNPYVLIFHKDTQNNHVHIVSCRVDKQARLLDTGFTYIKAAKVLNQLMGIDERLTAEEDLNLALSYAFSSREQFELVLRSLGYSIAKKEGDISLCRFGRRMIDVEIGIIDQRISPRGHDSARAFAIGRIIEAQKKVTHPLVYKKKSFYGLPSKSRIFTSALSEELRRKSGLHFFFHAETDRMPATFTVVDHTTARVFKGAEIMPLEALIKPIWDVEPAFQTRPGQFTELNITDDVDDEAVFGRKRHGNRKDHPQELTR